MCFNHHLLCVRVRSLPPSCWWTQFGEPFGMVEPLVPSLWRCTWYQPTVHQRVTMERNAHQQIHQRCMKCTAGVPARPSSQLMTNLQPCCIFFRVLNAAVFLGTDTYYQSIHRGPWKFHEFANCEALLQVFEIPWPQCCNHWMQPTKNTGLDRGSNEYTCVHYVIKQIINAIFHDIILYYTMLHFCNNTNFHKCAKSYITWGKKLFAPQIMGYTT